MNIKIEETDFDALDKLAALIDENKIEGLRGSSLDICMIAGKEYSTKVLPAEAVEQLIELKNKVELYWIDANESSIFFTLGSWVDAGWGVAKVKTPTDFTSPINRKIHEWKKVKAGWYYYLYE